MSLEIEAGMKCYSTVDGGDAVVDVFVRVLFC
jgi:hypothetical protein